MKALEIKDLYKAYKKGRYVLKGLNFQVEPGEVFGLIGPNGSGKTTTLRIISTLITPSKGTAIVYGNDVRKKPEKVRELIAYLPEEAGVYERLTGWENLLYYAVLYTGNWKKAEEIAEYGAKISGLEKNLERRTGEYSKGMKRRIGLARTLMVKPKLALLDEATTGLDVFAAVEIRDIIKEYAKKHNTAIVFSSHNMLEVESVCDRIGFILNGRIIALGNPDEIKEYYKAENLEKAFVKAVKEKREEASN